MNHNILTLLIPLILITACATSQAPTLRSQLHKDTHIAVLKSNGKATAKIDNLTKEEKIETALAAILDGAVPNSWKRRSDGTFEHDLSGLICDNLLGLISGATLEDIHLFSPDGTDSACNYTTNGSAPIFTLYVSKWPDVALKDHFRSAALNIQRAMPVRKGASSMTAQLERDPDDGATIIPEKTMSAAFELKPVHGRDYKTALWVSKVGSWHLKLRATYLTDDMATELLAAISFTSAIDNVYRKVNNLPPPKSKTDPSTIGEPEA